MSLEPRAGSRGWLVPACPSPTSPFPFSSPARTCRPCLENSGGQPGQWGREGWVQGGGAGEGVFA